MGDGPLERQWVSKECHSLGEIAEGVGYGRPMAIDISERVNVSLLDRYRATEGRVLLSGVQALVRLAMDQRRADLATGRDTAGFISGYPGSPLAGLDLELTRRADLLSDLDVVHRPGLNEELAATAVAGSQLAMTRPDHTKEGVFAMWYGKAPGLDRASDALRHGNLMGAHRLGGVLVCVGDDPQAKSSSVPSTSEPALYSLAMPILAPADPQEILDLGRHGFALSRLCGLWVGMRIPASVADCTQTVEVSPGRVRPLEPDLVVDGAPFAHQVSAQLLGAKLIELETSLYGPRIEIARRYAAVNALNQVTARGPNDVLGIVAAGPAYLSVVRALHRVGLEMGDLAGAGVRLLKVSMPFPLDEDLVQEFAAGLEEILVVEDKRAFLETLIKSALYRVAGAPAIIGKADEEGRVLVPATGEVDPDSLVGVIAARLLRCREVASVQRWTERTRPVSPEPLSIVRGAYFCSGCPHNTSVRVPEGAIVGSGSGCHGLAIQMDTRQVGTVVGRFQMGGEGAMWNGMAPFVSTSHFFQNLGDGTLAHSGSLAIRAAVASKVNITFKLLVNDTVAMTGGQPIAGGRGVGDLVRQLLAEGVRRIIITSDEPRRARAKGLPRGVDVWPRRRLVEAQALLASTPGVTVLLHDQECAAELRRKRKRGLAVTPRERVHVNTRLCERCGDCGTASNCLSVRSVETPFGTKTQIHQESCNLDLSCLNGRCPALVTVRTPSTSEEPTRAVFAPLAVADPRSHVARDTFTVRLTGIGGTGVLTVAQIVAMAAHLEGRFVRELDQTGIAQKGGAVVSDLRLSTSAELTTARLGEEECDLYLGCDVLVAATSPNLMVASPQRTVAVTSTALVPIGRQIADSAIVTPPLDVMRARIDARSRPELNVWIDASRLAHERLGSDGYANVLLLGAAFQAGALPLNSASIERAIELNGVDVEANRQAFQWGRHEVASRLDASTSPPAAPAARDFRFESIVSMVGATSGGELDDLVRTRVADLADYQDREYAQEYARVLALARAADQGLGRGDGAFSRAVAVELHRLMSYKDEYEVARLHLSRGARDELEGAFGATRRVTYHLMPPSLGSLGLKKKLRLRWSATWAFHALRAARRLRGTALDPFGRSAERREERRVRDDYVATVEHLSKTLRTDTYEFALEVANLPSEIRGFGEIKSLAIHQYEERRRDLLATTVPAH
jgi:indolepyruvate ferredoxin oxidoreductase